MRSFPHHEAGPGGAALCRGALPFPSLLSPCCHRAMLAKMGKTKRDWSGRASIEGIVRVAQLIGPGDEARSMSIVAPHPESVMTTSLTRAHWFHAKFAAEADSCGRAWKALGVLHDFVPGCAEFHGVEAAIGR